jgi:hypothetical protein
MHDVQFGTGGPGYIDGFVKGATRGFAVVDGDEDVPVHSFSFLSC